MEFEYIQVVKELWETGKSDFKGEHFQMDDCRMLPKPQRKIPLICAGQSAAGMDFSARHADYNFCFGKGVNTPTAFAPTAARLTEAAEKHGRSVGSAVLIMVIADETDEAAMAKWESYKDGKDALEEYFFEVLPDYDEDRVYASDIKKVVQWYNLLQKNNLLDSLESEDESDTSEEE